MAAQPKSAKDECGEAFLSGPFPHASFPLGAPHTACMPQPHGPFHNVYLHYLAPSYPNSMITFSFSFWNELNSNFGVPPVFVLYN